MPNRVEILKRQFTNSVGLPFRELLPESTLVEALEAEKIEYRNRLFNPIVTLWAFLSQVLDTDKSLQNAVSRIISWLAADGEAIPSSDTGGYSKARKRLSEKFLVRLLGKTAQGLEKQTTTEDLWCDRHVKLCDGSTVVMSDTPLNQTEYPQHSNQTLGCGFPIAKIVVMFSLATGAALEILIAPFRTGEVTLARQLYPKLMPDDVVLADRAFGSYVDLVLIQQYSADAVFRKHQSRKSDFRRGKKLGIGDHIVTWSKPHRRPTGMSQDEFAKLPTHVQVREIHLLIQQKGFRSKEIILVTTLLDAQVYTKTKLAQLYQWRWQVEVDLRHVKTTLGMEMLRGKTPEMVRKEIYVHLLAYNLLRTVMWQAGKQAGVCPVRISLQGTRQHLSHFCCQFYKAGAKKRAKLYDAFLIVVTDKLLPERPYRYEPRLKKRRPKPYGWMQQPRDVLKRQLVA
ncbi:Transposase, IS4 family protein [Coleofasciculus chthonoplastes PCC 7420]|uniref:Transposase, IS4 family protein n=1 Tax=Coleofasciculus chthonoplastes PCC 7420 TaxID=118168 RepID=B4VWQ5_9CYAN|nr:IS4 family transposase [Coleofasciculus chthonoplastes]EDX73794.1 Transposase, IS4 family protein [Coleofasciculus chthonoplastes PCC 7420]